MHHLRIFRIHFRVKSKFVLTLTSILIVAVIGIEWARSDSLIDAYYWTNRNRTLFVIAFEGGYVWYQRVDDWPNRELAWCQRGEINVRPVIWPDRPVVRKWPWPRLTYESGWAHAILRGDGSTWYGLLNNEDPRLSGSEGRYRGMSAPLWPLLLLASALPAWRFAGWLRRRRDAWRRARFGRCTHCGYDLTGNVSGVCPECGRSVSQPVDSAAVNDQIPPRVIS